MRRKAWLLALAAFAPAFVARTALRAEPEVQSLLPQLRRSSLKLKPRNEELDIDAAARRPFRALSEAMSGGKPVL